MSSPEPEVFSPKDDISTASSAFTSPNMDDPLPLPDNVSVSSLNSALAGRKTKRANGELVPPMPIGSSPPRKRAKTEEEKEQRRIERIMRNRQAAHASREKKRKHVEESETRCDNLLAENRKLQSQMDLMKSAQTSLLDQNEEMMSQIKKLSTIIKTLSEKSGIPVDDLQSESPETSANVKNSSLQIENQEPILSEPPMIKTEAEFPTDISPLLTQGDGLAGHWNLHMDSPTVFSEEEAEPNTTSSPLDDFVPFAMHPAEMLNDPQRQNRTTLSSMTSSSWTTLKSPPVTNVVPSSSMAC